MAQERLQKILARAGLTSRREAETWIKNGRVRVGDTIVTELGHKADPRREAIFVDGKRLVAENLCYVVLHKPRDVVTTMRDPEGRTTVHELLQGLAERVKPVGRLDYQTSGVLLLTNDGDFAAKLSHPSTRCQKTYVAKVKGLVLKPDVERWEQQLVIDGKETQPAEVRLLRHEGDKSWIRIILHEGKNRQIRRLGEAAGFPVMRLARTDFAGITAEDLRPGQWRHLSAKELAAFRKEYGVPRTVRHPPNSRPLGKTARERQTARKNAAGKKTPSPKTDTARAQPNAQRPAKRVAKKRARRGAAR